MSVIRNTNQSLRPRLPHEIILPIAEDDSLEWEDLRRLRHACPVLFDELGFTFHVTIRLQKPYWDYYIICRCSSMLRNPKVTLEIDLDEGAWSQVPQHYRPLLMAMVEFSITGVQVEKDLEDQREGLTNKEERYLLRHGCMPVRSLKVVHYRQTEILSNSEDEITGMNRHRPTDHSYGWTASIVENGTPRRTIWEGWTAELGGSNYTDGQCPLEQKISQKTINPKEDEIQVLLRVERRNCCYMICLQGLQIAFLTNL